MLKIVIKNPDTMPIEQLEHSIAMLDRIYMDRKCQTNSVDIQTKVSIPAAVHAVESGASDEETLDIIMEIPSVDASGLPWDTRIHASTKTMTQAGEWKKRKGVERADVDRIEAELRQAANAPGKIIIDTVASVELPTVINLFEQIAPFYREPCLDNTELLHDYRTLVPFLTVAVNENRTSKEKIVAAIMALGLPSFPMLEHRPELIPQLLRTLGL